MKTHFEIIAFLTAGLLAACGGTDSSLLNTSSAPLASKSRPPTPSQTADAGTPTPAYDDHDHDCYGDEYCEQEHHHGDDDKPYATAPDAGSPACNKGDDYSEKDCKHEESDDSYEHEDRGGSNSGPH